MMAAGRETGGDRAVLRMYPGATFVLRQRESQSRPQRQAQSLPGGTTMTIHQYVSKAVQDDAQRAGERNRLLLEARRARVARRKPVVSAAPARRLARLLLLRRAPA
jgi:hypothetical protein